MTQQQIKTGVFSDHEIREALKNGQIIISPFRDSQLNTSSYDVTLGDQFYVCQADDFQTDFNPYDKKDVDRYYKGPLRAVTNKEWCEEHRGGKLWKHIPAKQKIIVLKPGECILSHTQEFIGIQDKRGKETIDKS